VISVVLADDQALVRAGFRMILQAQRDITVVGEAANGAAAVRLVAELEPDVTLMDIRMPELDGIEATTRIARAGSATRVVILTTFDLDEYVYRAFRSGASGFLLKNGEPERLIEAVRAAAAGEALLAPEPTRRLIERYSAEPTPDAEPRLAELTERELDVLRLVARGLSNAEIAQQLYLSHGTVKTHVTRMLSKLGLRDRVQAVVLAYETGIARPGSSATGRVADE
jgi:DNA-binding NarL/FixJ family response regulator